MAQELVSENPKNPSRLHATYTIRASHPPFLNVIHIYLSCTRLHAIMCAPISSYHSVIHSFILRDMCLTNLLLARSLPALLVIRVITLLSLHISVNLVSAASSPVSEATLKEDDFASASQIQFWILCKLKAYLREKWWLRQLGWELYGLGSIPQDIQYGSAVQTAFW